MNRGAVIRVATTAMVAVVMLTSCGESPLRGIGSRSQSWVDAGAPTTVEGTVRRDFPIHATSRVDWANDRFGDPSARAGTDAVLRRVWKRREAGEEYLQASRFEIARVLRGVEFPMAVPDEVLYVTSQLVFTGDGTMADPLLAAFGLWTIPPYSQSRSVGQSGVLSVMRPFPAGPLAAGDDGCSRFTDRVLESCARIRLEDRPAWVLTDPVGTTIVWEEGSFRYELLYRDEVKPVVARAMAVGMAPINRAVSAEPDLAELLRRARRTLNS
ncbi:MAG TPA: hypothetical protein VHM94_15765 [Acidimicrobiia bacterium]|nr:hypothetical protein [Acidimicrobiia bacterium]